jgi:hypothetical protein
LIANTRVRIAITLFALDRGAITLDTIFGAVLLEATLVANRDTCHWARRPLSELGVEARHRAVTKVARLLFPVPIALTISTILDITTTMLVAETTLRTASRPFTPFAHTAFLKARIGATRTSINGRGQRAIASLRADIDPTTTFFNTTTTSRRTGRPVAPGSKLTLGAAWAQITRTNFVSAWAR